MTMERLCRMLPSPIYDILVLMNAHWKAHFLHVKVVRVPLQLNARRFPAVEGSHNPHLVTAAVPRKADRVHVAQIELERSVSDDPDLGVARATTCDETVGVHEGEATHPVQICNHNRGGAPQTCSAVHIDAMSVLHQVVQLSHGARQVGHQALVAEIFHRASGDADIAQPLATLVQRCKVHAELLPVLGLLQVENARHARLETQMRNVFWGLRTRPQDERWENVRVVGAGVVLVAYVTVHALAHLLVVGLGLLTHFLAVNHSCCSCEHALLWKCFHLCCKISSAYVRNLALTIFCNHKRAHLGFRETFQKFLLL
mmetsp:Transcript_28004/g.53304  ORF Transcript_28004/g.53304 Transcript_28004/m.53304 type:complete len:314 (+) Transcript_28004:441-1382(+)